MTTSQRSAHQYTGILVSLFLILPLASCSSGGPVSLADTHVHGLAVDRGDSNRLYIATHNGLFILENDTQLSLVGGSRDDFMGFSPHPTDPNILMSSGHPSRGGNLGFLKSTNAGKTWTKIHNGNPQGPADFHAMMVHPANPDHIYGWYKLRVHRSLDGGKTWAVLPNQPPEVMSFAGDPRDEDTLYFGSIGDLLMTSDRGETFVSIAPELKNDVIFDLEMEPESSSFILATRDHGFMRASRNPDDIRSDESVSRRIHSAANAANGFVFETLGNLPNADIPYYLALDPKNPEVLYSFSKAHVLYKSTDSAKSWQKLL